MTVRHIHAYKLTYIHIYIHLVMYARPITKLEKLQHISKRSRESEAWRGKETVGQIAKLSLSLLLLPLRIAAAAERKLLAILDVC